MTDEIEKLLEKAQKSLDAAEELLQKGYSDFSISRAYYAMLYCARALLLSKELSFKKHSSVISAFGREFIKSHELPQELHRFFLEAFKDRQKADYETEFEFTDEDASSLLKKAKEFLEKTKEYIK